jgi:hypothetical protein
MDGTRYRVLPGPDEGLCLLDRQTYEPVALPPSIGENTAGHTRGTPAEHLQPGYLVEAALDRSGDKPDVRSLSVHRPTLYAFADRIEPVFEAAQEAWADARAAGESMNGRVTRNTDNVVNGAVYVFADDGSRFAEFRDGTRPLEPLIDRVNDRDEPAPRELFVLRPAEAEFLVVTVAFEKGGRFADTLRETYGCPRPAEPLV